jgi:hypothetical protein
MMSTRNRVFLGLLLAAIPSTVFAGPVPAAPPAAAPISPPAIHPAASSSDFSNVKTFTAPDVGSATGKVTFETQGVRLNGSAPTTGNQPQQITLMVPQGLQKARLAHIELVHSQQLGEKTQPWSGKKGERDQTAPYSKVEVYVEGKGWTDLGQPKKFAEARQEVERLHDLPDSKGPISAVRIRNVGVDPVHVQGLTLHFLPPKPKSFDEALLMPTTSFGDAWSEVSPRTARLRDVQVQGTRYPGGITLNNNGKWTPTSQATAEKVAARGWTVDRDSVSIPLTPGKRLRLAEVAVGDTQPDPDRNGDGSFGRKGYAKLNMTIERHDGTRVPLTTGENIPSEGVLVAGSEHRVEPGDRLRIQVSADTAGLMGVRLGYDD